MMKIFKLCSIIILLLFLLTPYAGAMSSADEIKAQTEEGFFGTLDEELSDLLESFGIDSLDGNGIFSRGTENIKNYFSSTLKEKLKGAAGWFFLQLCIIMLLSVVSSAFDFSSGTDILPLFSAAIMTLGTVGKLSDFLSCTVSAMALNGKLMLSFIPVFALLISLSGNPASALTYNSFVLFFCEAVSFFLDNMFVSLVGAYFALMIAFSFSPGINLNRFINAVNRAVSLLLGFGASMFTGLLSLKNVLSYSTDSLSVKGVRFLLSSLVPVIGSSLSEAYSAVLGSINLMKSSLAVIGIFSLVIINIPPLTEGVIYFFLMSALSCFAEILGLYRVSEIMRGFASCVKILLLVCLFQVFVLIISIGIMLTVKGGING